MNAALSAAATLWRAAAAQQPWSRPELALAGLAISHLDIDAPEVRFDLKLDIWERLEGCSALFEFNTDVLDAVNVAAMAEHFTALLRHFLAHPDDRLSTATESCRQEVRATSPQIRPIV